jgi:signal transduction histidine kinase
MFRSVTSRLVLLYCLLLVMLGAGFLAFTVTSFSHYTRDLIASNLSIRAEGVWSVSRAVLDQPARLARVIEAGFSPEVQSRFIRIRTGDKILYRSGQPADRRFDPRNLPLTQPVTGNSGRLVDDVLLIAHQYRDDKARIVTVEVGQSFYFVHILQTELATSLLVALPILLALAGLAGYVLMRRAQVPVEAMVKAAETYSFNQPHMRLPLVRNEPRIEALGLALNRLLDRLDSAYTHASRFSADAAHELRTPLTIVRGELELLATGKELSPDIEAAVLNALEEITRLSGIVDSLIMLSRMESMWGKKTHAPVNLRALAEDTLIQINLLAVERDIRLIGPLGPSVVVAGDGDRLKQVLVNLLDNAIKYTPVGGKVTVLVGADGDKGFIAVEDTGIGIASAHQLRVFDRFYRVSPDRGGVGAGLGLAIVKSICLAHGGTVTLQSEAGMGSCFRVEIPLMRKADKETLAETTAAAI